jgi:hypothetical protein
MESPKGGWAVAANMHNSANFIERQVKYAI